MKVLTIVSYPFLPATTGGEICTLGLHNELAKTNEVTVYKIFHNTDKPSNLKIETMNPMTYKTLNEKQVVIYWGDGDGPFSYEKCVIRDYKNWKCSPELSQDVQMVDGKYSNSWCCFEGIEIVPKWKWWVTKFNEWTS